MSLSGGMDSTCLLLWWLSKGYRVDTATFFYGQRHEKEITSAEFISDFLGVSNTYIDLSTLQEVLTGSALTSVDIDVPEGHYEEESMKKTVVANRNAIFLNILAGYAISREIPIISYGAHAGDHAIYPDCRESFVMKMEDAINEGNYFKIEISSPFVGLHKGQVLERGLASCEILGVDPVKIFSHTWTCYKGEDEPCGKCGCCVERKEAFDFCNISDPLLKAV